MEHWAPLTDDASQWHATYQRFTYDSLNRLQQAREDANGHNESSDLWWVQQFDYDRWGNRQINAAATKSWTLSGGNRVEIQTEINEKQFQILTGNNRLKAPTDTNDGNETNDQMRYDAAGNLIRDEYTNPANPTREFLFDSGGRIGITRDNAGTELARYIYDSEGARVRRIIRNGQGGYDETWLVYGLGGELVAEYANNVGAATPQKEYGYRGGELLLVTTNGRRTWLVQDHLGSTRMVIDESGRLTDNAATPTVNEAVIRHDFLPFGEELPATASRRTAAQGYGISNDPRQKFTGYERDDETGLDFAQARYYASVQGRFTSPDPLVSSGSIGEPQGWNKYAYVGNRPLLMTDPSGLLWYIRKLENGNYEVRWFDNTPNPGEGWKLIVINGAVVYKAVTGHLISLSNSSKYYRNLTQEALRLEHIQKAAKAHADAEAYVNGIILSWISTAVNGGVSYASGGLWGLAKDILIDQAVDYATQKLGSSDGSSVAEAGVTIAGPFSIPEGTKLNEHLRQAEEYGQGGVKELENGRIRYYGEIDPANKPGEMAGRRMVREWDPVTGAKRTWHETLDHSGNVRIVRPETGGSKVHYMFNKMGKYVRKF